MGVCVCRCVGVCVCRCVGVCVSRCVYVGGWVYVYMCYTQYNYGHVSIYGHSSIYGHYISEL